MPAEMRRAAVIDATIPLLRRLGATVTTRQIADAAGIAEGTIFRVFEDKDALISAAVAQVLDQRPTIAELRRIDMALPLPDRLRAAVEVIIARLDAVWELMFAMSQPDHAPPPRYPAEPADDSGLPDALTALIEPDADQLRVPAEQTARLLRLVTFAGSHPRITDANPLAPQEIVDLLLDGVRARSVPPTDDSPHIDTQRDDPC